MSTEHEASTNLVRYVGNLWSESSRLIRITELEWDSSNCITKFELIPSCGLASGYKDMISLVIWYCPHWSLARYVKLRVAHAPLAITSLVGAKPLSEPMLELMGPLGTDFNPIEIYKFSFKKIHFKMASGKWRLSCLGLDGLTYTNIDIERYHTNSVTTWWHLHCIADIHQFSRWLHDNPNHSSTLWWRRLMPQ